MGILNFGAADTIKPTKPKPKVTTSANRAKTPIVPASRRRRPLENEKIYGEELFLSARKKEKEIVVCFMPFTRNGIRISTDGKFAIGYSLSSVDEEGNCEFFSLFYFKEAPIDSFIIEKPKRMIAFLDRHAAVIEKTADLEEVKLKIISCVKEEYLVAKTAKMDEIITKEHEEKVDKARKEDEAEKLSDMLESAPNFSLKKEIRNESITGFASELPTNSNTEDNNVETKVENGAEIQKEENKSDDSEISENKEAGKSGILSFKQIE